MLGITPEGIGDYVATLTPVVLLSDTVVTNHGFKNGHATTLTSVLQAGTAVMVDPQGVPRVKCNCGNPLTPPQVVPSDDWKVHGEAWDGFDARRGDRCGRGGHRHRVQAVPSAHGADLYPARSAVS